MLQIRRRQHVPDEERPFLARVGWSSGSATGESPQAELSPANKLTETRRGAPKGSHSTHLEHAVEPWPRPLDDCLLILLL
jgi:hypothetical protein